ncbi:MAG: hypothetical protein RIA10_07625 [Amphiplicatus sp.]
MSAVSTDPTLTPEKRARLVEFFGSLPDATAARLFAALEHDRVRGGKGLPHDALIADLRRQLAAHDAAFPARPMTAQRLFFKPFEDFFIARRTGRKRRARIARASIGPVWAVLTQDPAASGAARAIAALDAAIAAGSANVAAFEAQMLAEAAIGAGRAIAHANEDAAFRADLAERLGGEEGLEDFIEIARLLPAAPHLRAVQSAFRKPVATLTEEELFDLRRLYGRARAESPEAAPYLLLALMGRMEAPWRALSAYYHLAGARDEALAGAGEDAAVILETLFEDLESGARGLERRAVDDFDAGEASMRLNAFAELAEGIAGEAYRAADKVALNRVEACRDVAADCLARFAEQSLAAMRKAMPVRHAGGSSRLMGLRPDYARALTPRVAAAAREASAFLAETESFAARLGRPKTAASIVRDAGEEARRYAGDLVLEIRAAEGEDRAAARRMMEHALAVAAALAPRDEIDLLRERANAAAVTA